jgi:hypothetical protein
MNNRYRDSPHDMNDGAEIRSMPLVVVAEISLHAMNDDRESLHAMNVGCRN